YRDPLQRVRQHRCVRGVLAAGGAGAGDAGVEVLVGVPPQRRPRLAQEACMSAFVPAARDDRRAPPATGAQGAAPTETLNVLLTQDPTLRTVHPARIPRRPLRPRHGSAMIRPWTPAATASTCGSRT